MSLWWQWVGLLQLCSRASNAHPYRASLLHRCFVNLVYSSLSLMPFSQVLCTILSSLRYFDHVLFSSISFSPSKFEVHCVTFFPIPLIDGDSFYAWMRTTKLVSSVGAFAMYAQGLQDPLVVTTHPSLVGSLSCCLVSSITHMERFRSLARSVDYWIAFRFINWEFFLRVLSFTTWE